ncbi:recQ [Mytilus edulis]|uniref:RecQ n=1 Tax=Mytilus edulis TaxID=6550 RepID=A0A8S3TZM2_MYTED|nr:recQ [Mytilus edulis]
MADYKSHLRVLNKESFNLKEKQIEILDMLQKGKKEIIGILPTGYGKSLIYEIAPLMLSGTVIVISPLTSIQVEQFQRLRETPLKTCILNVKGRIITGLDIEDEMVDMQSSTPKEEIYNTHLIFAHPEAIFNTVEGRKLLDCDSFPNEVIGNDYRDVVFNQNVYYLRFLGVPNLDGNGTSPNENVALFAVPPSITNVYALECIERAGDFYMFRPVNDNGIPNPSDVDVRLLMSVTAIMNNVTAPAPGPIFCNIPDSCNIQDPSIEIAECNPVSETPLESFCRKLLPLIYDSANEDDSASRSPKQGKKKGYRKYGRYGRKRRNKRKQCPIDNGLRQEINATCGQFTTE